MPCLQVQNGITAESIAVVVEKQPRWTPELQRCFAGTDVRVRACRSTSDVMPVLQTSGSCVLILDLNAGADDCLQLVGRLAGATGFVPIVVIGSPRMAQLEWPIRELGAVEFLFDTATGEDVASICRKQWALAGQAD